MTASYALFGLSLFQLMPNSLTDRHTVLLLDVHIYLCDAIS